MRYFIMNVYTESSGGGIKFIYPLRYLRECSKVALGPIYDEKENGDCFIGFGVKNKDVAPFIGCDGVVENGKKFDVREVQKSGIIGFWKQTEDMKIRKFGIDSTEIIDKAKVIKILAKNALGESLTETDRNSLDPEHSEPGIQKRPSVEERIERILQKHGDER